MNNLLTQAIILGLILLLICAPFAGFAPLLLVVLIASCYWFITSIVKVIVWGDEPETSSNRKDD